MPHELEIIGPASPWLTERVHAYCDALVGHPWGEVPSGRLIVAEDYPTMLQRYLPAGRWKAWAARQRGRADHGTGVGMGFVANDGVPTAIAAALPGGNLRDELLCLVCHELTELSMDATNGEDHVDVTSAMGGVIWSEHTVKRRRSMVFTNKGWDSGKLSRDLLLPEWERYVAAHPQLLATTIATRVTPQDVFGHWQMLTLQVVNAYAHAQGGVESEAQQLEAFLDQQTKYMSNAWLDLMLVCDEAFASPGAPKPELNALGSSKGWTPLYAALSKGWEREYFDEGGI